MTQSDTVDFRTRTGQMRRARTRKRILAAAFELFDKNGVGQVTIDQVREAAGLSRGTFYNYFATYDTMLFEIAKDITLQINREQDQYFSDEADDVVRLYRTMTYFLARTVPDRACCEVLVRVMPLTGSPTETMQSHAMAWFIEAKRTGLIKISPVEIALEAGYGIGAAILRRAIVQGTNAAEIATANTMFLRAIGITEKKLQRLLSLPSPKLPKVALRALIVEGPALPPQAA